MTFSVGKGCVRVHEKSHKRPPDMYAISKSVYSSMQGQPSDILAKWCQEKLSGSF